MSTRAIKKLNKKDDLKLLEEIKKKKTTSSEDGDGSESEENFSFPINKFSLLDDAENDAAESARDDLDGHDDDDKQPATTSKNKNRSKKNKGKKTSNLLKKEDGDDHVSSAIKYTSNLNPAEEEDTEEVIKSSSSNLKDEEISAKYVKIVKILEKASHLMKIESKHLNYENEMIRMFGARVVQNERMATAAAASNHHHHNNRRHKPAAFRHSANLVNRKNTWPEFSKFGLSMRLISTKSINNSNNNGSSTISEFTLEHSPAYQNLHFAFIDAVESMDHNNIMRVLFTYPYHVDSLIQMSEVSRLHDDSQMGADLIERALYAIQSSLHPSFHLIGGNSSIHYLDYNRVENRCFFIALFKHILNISSKACYRTSLELSKLLLSLDVDGDPLAIILLIDLYAIRSSQFSFLIEFYDLLNPHKHLNLLPNMLMSVALAHYYLYKQTNQQRHLDQANELLKDALIKFPYLLLELLKKCSVVAPQNADTNLEKSKIFSTVKNLNVPVGLKYLCDLYALRMHHEWKIAENLEWLEKNVREIVQNEKQQFESHANDHRKKFASMFAKVPSNIYRHVILSDYKEIPANLPPEYPSSATYIFDPVPPKNSIITYTRPPRPTSSAAAGAAGNQSFSDSLLSFIQSIFPSYDAQQQALQRVNALNNQNAADENPAAGAGVFQGFDMRQMAAQIRELFLFQGGENPNFARADNDEQDDDEEQQHDNNPNNNNNNNYYDADEFD